MPVVRNRGGWGVGLINASKKVAPRLLEVLNQYLSAITQGNTRAYYSAMSARMANETKNNRLSMLREAHPAPGELKRQYEDMKDTFGPLPIRRVAGMIHNEVMAVLVLLRPDVDGGGGMAVFQPFYREGGAWRVDMPRMVFFSKGKLPRPRPALSSAIPRAPARLTAKPDYRATFNVNAYHYKVRLTVNGRRIAAVSGGKSEAGLLLGGLRKGKNVFLVTYRRAADAPPSSVELIVHAHRSIQAKGQRLEIIKETKEPRGKVRRVVKLP